MDLVKTEADRASVGTSLWTSFDSDDDSPLSYLPKRYDKFA